MNRAGGTRQPALEYGTCKGSARPPLPRLLGHKLIDIGGDGLIERVLLAIEAEAHRLRMPVREEPAPVEVSQILLETTQRPRAVLPELKNVLAQGSCLPSQAVWFREEVRVQKAQEMAKPVLVTMMGCRR